MVFQDPFSALNPVHTIDHHLRVPLRKLRKMSKNDCDGEIKRLLQLVDLPLDFSTVFHMNCQEVKDSVLLLPVH